MLPSQVKYQFGKAEFQKEKNHVPVLHVQMKGAWYTLASFSLHLATN